MSLSTWGIGSLGIRALGPQNTEPFLITRKAQRNCKCVSYLPIAAPGVLINPLGPLAHRQPRPVTAASHQAEASLETLADAGRSAGPARTAAGVKCGVAGLGAQRDRTRPASAGLFKQGKGRVGAGARGLWQIKLYVKYMRKMMREDRPCRVTRCTVSSQMREVSGDRRVVLCQEGMVCRMAEGLSVTGAIYCR